MFSVTRRSVQDGLINIVTLNKGEKGPILIDVAVPGDARVAEKEVKKLKKISFSRIKSLKCEG